MASGTRDVRTLRSVPTAVADGLISRGCRDAASLLAEPELVIEVLQQLRAPDPQGTAAKIIAASRAEVAGRWRSAPSALELLQQANAQLNQTCSDPNESNQVFEAVYIDSEGSFTVSRYSDFCKAVISERRGRGEVSPDLGAVLAGLHVYRVFDSIELVSAVMVLDAFLAQHPRVKLIALDSVAFCFRHELNDDFAARARALLQIASALRELSKKHGVAVMVTNHITTKVGDGGRSSQLVPALGDTWAHQPSMQIRLDKAGLQIAGWQVGTATLTKSVEQATGQHCTFMITAGGIRDAAQGQ